MTNTYGYLLKYKPALSCYVRIKWTKLVSKIAVAVVTHINFCKMPWKGRKKAGWTPSNTLGKLHWRYWMEPLGVPTKRNMEVVADRDVWRLNLELLPPQPSRTWAGTERRHFDNIRFLQNLAKGTSLLGGWLGWPWSGSDFSTKNCMQLITYISAEQSEKLVKGG